MAAFFRLFISLFLALWWLISPSFAVQRIALVIGNSNYLNLQVLPNPSNDARLMADTLRKLDFEVITAFDADRVTMTRAMRKFGRALRAGGRDTVGLFYYAGHGVQSRGENYLIPLSADVQVEDDLVVEAVSAANVLLRMESAGNALNMVILDACRNNPYKGSTRANSGGLIRVQAASGSLVAFAAAPGQVAADGTGKNSPYTQALVEAMQIPGLTVEQMFKRVRVSVENQTAQRQTPWEESSLKGDFYFVPGDIPQVLAPLPALSPAAQEWAAVQNTRSSAVLNSFIKRYPKSVYAGYAKATLSEKEQPVRSAPPLQPQVQQQIDPRSLELSYWNSIQTSNNPALFEDYLKQNPNGYFAVIAREKLRALKDPKAKKRKLRIASLPPGSSLDAQLEETPNRRRLTTILQKQLKRVGCYQGKIDGQWGRGSAGAVKRFNKYAKTTLPSNEAYKASIGELISRPSRVCPLICRGGFIKRGGKCVRKAVAKAPASQSNNSSFGKYKKGDCRAGILEACRRACKRGYERACRKARFLGG